MALINNAIWFSKTNQLRPLCEKPGTPTCTHVYNWEVRDMREDWAYLQRDERLLQEYKEKRQEEKKLNALIAYYYKARPKT